MIVYVEYPYKFDMKTVVHGGHRYSDTVLIFSDILSQESDYLIPNLVLTGAGVVGWDITDRQSPSILCFLQFWLQGGQNRSDTNNLG